MSRRHALAVPLLAAALAAASGCGVYSASSGRVDENIQHVYVEYLEARTAEPRIGVEMAEAIIDALRFDNTFKVVGEADADAIISGTVNRYKLQPMAARQDLTVNEYQLRIDVTLSFTVRATGETLFKDKRFSGSGTYVLDDPTGQTSEATAKEEAVNEIVKDIRALVVEDW